MLVTDEPLVRAVDSPHMRHLVLKACGGVGRPQVLRLGEVRVAIDDLDPFKERINAP